MSEIDVICDHAKQNLLDVPKDVLNKCSLKMLFLEGNLISELPSDFFQRFPKLIWLDLRNNALENIPAGIANHKCLESLLISNNKISRLPNELGTVPNLVTLQIADNPIVYPNKNVIMQGTMALLTHLRTQYNKENPDVSNESEVLMRVIEEEFFVGENSKEIKKQPKETKEKEEIVKKALNVDPKELKPTLSVQKLLPPKKKYIVTKVPQEPIKIIHKLNRNPSKISLKSYYNKIILNNIDDLKSDNALKDVWLEKLKILLNDQEKILQQERNLRSLASWRLEKKQQAINHVFPEEVKLKRPFGTNPEDEKMMTRDDLAKGLDEYLKERTVTPKRPGTPHDAKIDKRISDLVRQMKDVEVSERDMQSPRTEIEQAERQIKTIMDIHKKLLKLQEEN